MLSFSDDPYIFVEPRPCKPLIAVMRIVNQFISLRAAHHRITGVDVQNGAKATEAAASGKRLLFVPNHSTHSDVEIITDAYRQLSLNSQYMAAYDVFQRSRLRSWLMQRGGAFSVDREGSDKQSMKQAIKTLVEGEYGLTIFPEGNVHFSNERVTPFLEGAAFIALQAQRELADKADVFIVPVAIKVTHVTDQRAKIRQRLDTLAKEVGDTLNPISDIGNELSRIGVELLRMRLRESGYTEVRLDNSLQATLDASVETIVKRLETILDIKPKTTESVGDRARRIRRDIHRALLEAEENPLMAKKAKACANDAMLALRIASYLTDYVTENPTMDRVGEMVEKLKEDLTDTFHFAYAPRHATVSFADPIPVKNHLGGKLRKGVGDLTSATEQAVQSELNRLSKNNPYPGGERFTLSNP